MPMMASDVFRQSTASRQQASMLHASRAPASKQRMLLQSLAAEMILGRRKRGGTAGMSFFEMLFGGPDNVFTPPGGDGRPPDGGGGPIGGDLFVPHGDWAFDEPNNIFTLPSGGA